MKPFRVLLLAATLTSAPSWAQPRGMAGRWQVDWGDRRCALIRHPVGDQPTMVLRTIPGSRIWELMFMRSALPSGLRGDHPNVVVRLQPDGPRVEREAFGGTTSLGATISVGGFERDFIEQLQNAQAVSIGTADRVIYQVPIPQVREAIAALRECEVDAMRQWGIDVEAFAAVSVPARGNMAGVFTDADYPQQLLRSRASGASIVRITVDANGRVGECAPVAGSNNAVLDSTTCRIMQRRATFSPARDANGNAISSQLVTIINWRLY